MGNSLQTRKFWASQECWYISFSHCLVLSTHYEMVLSSHHTNLRGDQLIVEDKFQALMVDDGETFRNWNRLLWGPRSTGNYLDTRRRCEVSTFPRAVLLLWGGRGWVRNRMVVPDIMRTVICLEILKVIKRLTFTSHFFFQTSNSLNALISVGCCIHSITWKYPL